jgi:hypothetical protein
LMVDTEKYLQPEKGAAASVRLDIRAPNPLAPDIKLWEVRGSSLIDSSPAPLLFRLMHTHIKSIDRELPESITTWLGRIEKLKDPDTALLVASIRDALQIRGTNSISATLSDKSQFAGTTTLGPVHTDGALITVFDLNLYQ